MPICEDLSDQVDREEIICVQKWLTDKDADMIVDVLQKNKCKKFVLARNDLGPEAATKIADAMVANTSVTFLSLAGNKFNDDGALEFVKVLKGNTTMETIFLSDNFTSEKTCDELYAANAEREKPLPENLYGIVLDHKSPKAREREAAAKADSKKKKTG